MEIFHYRHNLKGGSSEPRNIIDIKNTNFTLDGASIKAEMMDKSESFEIRFNNPSEAKEWIDIILQTRKQKQSQLSLPKKASSIGTKRASFTNTSGLNVTQLRIAESNKSIALDGKALLVKAMSSSTNLPKPVISASSVNLSKKISESAQFSLSSKKLSGPKATNDPFFVHELDDGESWIKGKGGDDESQAHSLLKEGENIDAGKLDGPSPLLRLTSLRIRSKIDLFKSITQSAFPERMYAQVGCEDMLVRGATYLEDGLKIVPKRSLFKLICIDLFDTGKDRFDHISSHPKNRVAQAIAANEMPPFVWTINFQVPGPPFYSFVIYLAPQDTIVAALLNPDGATSNKSDFAPGLVDMFKSFFFSDDDEYRDSRFKLVPRIVDGPWLVRKSVPNKPAILGKALKQRYFKGPGYLELDIDIGSSKIAWSITSKLLIMLCFTGLILQNIFRFGNWIRI